MQRIIVRVSPNGETTVKAEGYQGKSCQDATKALRAALGQQIEEKRTGDYYRTADQAENRATY